MGRLTFGETIYLLLVGEVPTPGMGRLMEALLVSFIDHGATPPSTLAARNTATTGAPLRACVAAGVLGFGRYHGGDIESCMQFLDSGLAPRARRYGPQAAAEQIVRKCVAAKEIPPGFGHRFHTRDPRAARLFQMALELEVEADHIQMIRAVEMVLPRPSRRSGPHTAGKHRRRDCCRLRRPGHPSDDCRRAVHHLARSRHRRPRRRRAATAAADATDRPEGSPLRRTVGAAPARTAKVT